MIKILFVCHADDILEGTHQCFVFLRGGIFAVRNQLIGPFSPDSPIQERDQDGLCFLSHDSTGPVTVVSQTVII